MPAKSYAQLTNWTPKRAHAFATRRIEKIKHLLTEIGACYGDVDGTVVGECDGLIHQGFSDLEGFLKDALDEGRSL